MQRLLVAAFGVAVAAAAAITVAASPASAAPRGGSATGYQNATIATALAHVPGGTRVSASQVQWPSGMTLTVAATPDQPAGVSPDAGGCPTSFFCVFNGPDYGGSIQANCPSSFLSGGTYFCPIGQVIDVVHSYSNVTAYRAWLQQFASHTNAGAELCINSRNFGGNSNPNYNGSSMFDDFVWMSDNTAAC